MKRILCLVAAFLALSASAALAESIYIKQEPYLTELYIKVSPDRVRTVRREGPLVSIYFTNSFTSDFGGRISDPFIDSVRVEGGGIIVSFKEDSTYTIFNLDDGLKLVASRKRALPDIQLSYGIEAPLIKRGAEMVQDAAAERTLSEIDNLVAQNLYDEAITRLNVFIQEQDNTFYRQEGMYRLGVIYYNLGEFSSNNYVTAAEIFEDFTKLYPESYRAADALVMAAQAKERAGNFYEAIFSYRKLIESTSDEQLQRETLKKIADIYYQVGQLDNTIAVYDEYLGKFRQDADKINAFIGSIYAQRGEYTLAREYFIRALQAETELSELPIDNIMAMAETFAAVGDNERALEMYTNVFNIYPEMPGADMAMYEASLILDEEGRDNATDDMLTQCYGRYPKQEGGLRCTLAYAQRHMEEKNTFQWQEFLQPVIDARIPGNLEEQSKLFLIRSAYDADNFQLAMEKINDFEANHFNSELLADVSDIKQNIYMDTAQAAFDSTNYQRAETNIGWLLQEFPESDLVPKARSMLEDIAFRRSKSQFASGQYAVTIDQVEDYISDNPDARRMDEWLDMLDDATHSYTQQLFEAGDYPGAIVHARQYGVSMPNGKYADSMQDIFERSTSLMMQKYSAEDRHVEVVKLYDDNRNILAQTGDTRLRDNLRSIAGLSLIRLGLPEDARNVIANVEHTDLPAYRVDRLLLDGRIPGFDPNVLDEPTLTFIVGELEESDVPAALALLQDYTADPVLASRLMFRLSKSITDEDRRRQVLLLLQDRLTQPDPPAFAGSDEVFLDIGISYFKEDNYTNAISSLNRFTSVHEAPDELRAEALFYLGKSYASLRQGDEARKHFNEIISNMPDSVYATVAKGELEDANWRNSLTR